MDSKPRTKVYFLADGDLLEKGLGVCADPQDPRLQYRRVCPMCPNKASTLTHQQALAIFPVLRMKFSEIWWELVPIETGDYQIFGYEEE